MPTIFGRTALTGTNHAFGSPTAKIASRFTNNSGNFTVRTMWAYSGNNFNIGNCRMAIYNTSGGLLAETEEFVPVAGALFTWIGAALLSPTSLAVTNGVDYFLAFHAEEFTQIRNAVDTGESWENEDTYSDGIADPFGSDIGANERECSIYASSAFLSNGGGEQQAILLGVL